MLDSLRRVAGRELEMKMALVGMTGMEPSLLAWQVALDRAGTPYDVLALAHRRERATLISGLRRTGFQALILAGADVLESALSAGQRAVLEALERRLRTRRVLAYAYPAPAHGLCSPSWAGSLDGLTATLTSGGRRLFPYLPESLEFDPGSWGYLAVPASDARFETLLAAPDGSTLLGIHRHGDGREEMVQTFAVNPGQCQALLLRFGQLVWVSGGSYLGFERNYLPLHVDDVFLANHSWSVATHTTEADPTRLIRMSRGDASRAASWARARGLRLDLVCNGAGSEHHAARTDAGTDPVLDALLENRTTFGWINHTYSHLDLDEAPRAVIEAEIRRNISWARGVGIELEPAALVTGAHSGLANLEATPPHGENPDLSDALHVTGVHYVACDASRPYPVAASDPSGAQLSRGVSFAIGRALAIPRHPTALPFDAATQRQAVDRWRTCPSGDLPATWEQVIAGEARRIFTAMLSNDPRPHYFHQSNLVSGLAGDPSRGGLLYDLIDAVLHRYRRSVSDMPIVQPTFGKIGELLRDQAAWRAALATGSVVAYRDASALRIENRSGTAVPVPLTGTSVGAHYGVARSGWILAEPGNTFVALETSQAAA